MQAQRQLWVALQRCRAQLLEVGAGHGDELVVGDEPLVELGDQAVHVIDALVDPVSGLSVDELAPVELMGRQARAFDVAGGPADAILVTDVDPGDDPAWGTWLRSPFARVWIVETDIGPLLISTFADSTSELNLSDIYTQRLARLLSIDDGAGQ